MFCQKEIIARFLNSWFPVLSFSVFGISRVQIGLRTRALSNEPAEFDDLTESQLNHPQVEFRTTEPESLLNCRLKSAKTVQISFCDEAIVSGFDLI